MKSELILKNSYPKKKKKKNYKKNTKNNKE